MPDEQRQKDLFDDYGRQRKQSKRLQDMLPKKVSFSFSLEHLVFLGIGAMMTMVLLFALGVEKGRRLVLGHDLTKRTAISEPKRSEPETVLTARKEPLKKAEEAVKADPAKLPDRAEREYTIQTATFRRKASAEEEASRLKKDGFEPYVIAKGDFFQVCVGNFRNKEDADKHLVKLRLRYKDCFIKKR